MLANAFKYSPPDTEVRIGVGFFTLDELAARYPDLRLAW